MNYIATHNGQFHADDVAACALLTSLDEDLVVLRTRDQYVIENATYVVDVGSVYDPDNNRFDHHQGKFYNNDIPMSSFGMVYLKYGKAYISKFTKHVDKVYNTIYHKFVKEIDAIDNGIVQCDCKQKYLLYSNISNIISDMNDVDVWSDEQYINFLEAMEYTKMVLDIKIRKASAIAEEFDKDYSLIEKCMENRFGIHDSGRILYIPTTCTTYKKCISKYENGNELIDFIIYPSGEEWRLRTINYNFSNRKDIKGDVEGDVEGDIIFIHANKFIASGTTLQSMIDLAVKSL